MGIPKKTRDALLVEACHRCTVCADKCFEIHHIVERAQGGNDEIDNLIVLCPNCHQHRYHRHKEITTEQLRLYKANLKVEREVEKRLLLNLDELVARIGSADSSTLAEELEVELAAAASNVNPAKSPIVYRKVSEVSTWLAERDLVKGGARRAIEVEWDLWRARELEKFPEISIISVDTENMERISPAKEIYRLRFNLSEVPSRDWILIFEEAYRQSMYMMKRRTTVDGTQLVMEVGSSDNLQAQANWAKSLISDTAKLFRAFVVPKIEAEYNRRKLAALREYDAIKSLRQRAKDIEM